MRRSCREDAPSPTPTRRAYERTPLWVEVQPGNQPDALETFHISQRLLGDFIGEELHGGRLKGSRSLTSMDNSLTWRTMPLLVQRVDDSDGIEGKRCRCADGVCIVPRGRWTFSS